MLHLETFFLSSDDPRLLLYGTYNPWLVTVSLAIAIASSMMALQTAGIARAAHSNWHRQVALISGSIALAGGIWSMHFIGMLAFSFCASVSYSPSVTVLSVLPSLAASWVALHILSRRHVSAVQLIVGGILVGAGIGAMHYSGMAAMQMAPLLRYEPVGFVLSILVAVGLAILSLWVRYGLRRWLSATNSLVCGGIVMGLAISGMHYTGMAGARFIGAAEFDPITQEAGFLAITITSVTIALILLVAAANGLLRFRQLYMRLQEQESRLRAVLDTAVDGVITFDSAGRIQGGNPAFERMFGHRFEDLKGANISEVIPSLSVGISDRSIKHIDGIGVGREVEALRADGGRLPVRLALGRATLPKHLLYVGFVTDLSDRNEMEQALRHSEQQYRSLIRNIPGVSFRCIADDNWTVVFISDAIERMTGWPAEEFAENRRSFASIYNADDYIRVRAETAGVAAKGGDYTVEFRLYDRDGHEHWVWENGTVVLDENGEPRWIDGVMLDITENKRRAAEFEGTVRAISRALSVIEFDMNGTILTANENFLQFTGYELKEIQGKHHSMFCDPAYVASPAYAEFWDLLISGELDAGEYERLGKDGRSRWIQATYNPIFNSDGRPFKVVKFATDISLRRDMEKVLREAKDKAEQAAASKTTFLANMSHEIRTPMNAIIGFTELLLDTSLDQVQRGHLSTVRYSARSLLGLLNDILDTAKLEKGALELEQIDFSLHDLCQHICKSLRLSAQAKGLVLTLDYQPGLTRLFNSDPLRIQQILTNLVGNAVKFTEYGGVRLEVSSTDNSGEIHFAVRDTGIGIEEDRLERIFAPFAQADASMSRRFGGTGLGTTIAQQLVDLLGGRLHVESVVGEGSVFHVYLPLNAASGAPDFREVVQERLPPLHILAADDVPQNLQLLGLSLGRRGHSVVTAKNGDEALAAFQLEHFDVLLLDVQMPGTDGLAAARQIRVIESEQGKQRTPIIALTASVLEEDRIAAREAGMDGFASKPLEIDRLLNEIARVTGRQPQFVNVIPPAITEDVDTVIDWVQGVQLWGTQDKLLTAINRFHEDNHRAAAQIAELNGHGLFVEASEKIHKIRGTAGNLSLVQLCKLSGQLEHAFRGKPKARPVEVLIAELDAAFKDLGRAIKDFKKKDSAPPSATMDTADLIAIAQQLRSSFQRGELDEQLFDMLVGQLMGQGRRDSVDMLERATNDFDFAQADVLLGTLIGTLSRAAEESSE
jgi:PAS domain S-box-containing protein